MQNFILGVVSAVRVSKAIAPVAEADVLMMIAFCSAILTLLFMLELRRSRHSLLAMGLSGTCVAVCTLLSGAWPGAVVLFFWAALNVRKWIQSCRKSPSLTHRGNQVAATWSEPTRVQRLFDDPPLTFN